MSILCIICARGGSKGIKNKALVNFRGKPLIFYTIKQALKAKIFEEVIVSTDSLKIQKIAKTYGAKSWFLRPKNISSDNASKLLAISHAFKEAEQYFKKKFDICFDLDLTSPLRNIDDIKKALKKFKKGNFNNLFSVTEAKKKPYFNMVEKNKNTYSLSKKSKKNIFSRQKTPKVFELNASLYIFSRRFLLKKNKLFNKYSSVYVMPRERSIDIDDYLDLKLARYLFKNDKKLSK